MRQRFTVLVFAGLLVLLALPATTAAAECQFILGFATLKALIDAAEGPDKVGDCLENQRFNPENGDALQQTTGGLLVWRKADNWTAFTDGYRTWINGPYGLQARLNTEQFDWEGPETPPASPVPTVEIGTEYTAQCSNGIAVHNPQGNPGLVADCAALLQSRDMLAGTTALDWSADRIISDWEGITVDGSPRRVTRLRLPQIERKGTIPPQLGTLSHLQDLFITGSGLTGPIPPQLGLLTNLEWLILYDNQLSGPIPPQLGTLTNLQYLYLSNNQLSGSIPRQLGSLANLEWLNLSDNQLSGPISPQLGMLTNLEGLQIRDNQLSGPLPSQLGFLTNLKVLDLRGNQLTGPIPPQLGSLANLERLELSNNQLSGPVPPQLGALAKKKALSLRGNAFTGCLPLALRGDGNLDEKLGIPFCGDEVIWQCSSDIVTSNQRDNPGLVADCVALLQVRDTLAGTTKLDWSTDRAIADWEGITIGGSPARVTTLELSERRLTGIITPELGALTQLEWLSLRGNQLSGPIPPRLGDLAKLQRLDLRDNQLTGPIPLGLGGLAKLEVLDLSANQLTGPIPPSLGWLDNLELLWLNSNQLTGPVPSQLGALAKLRLLRLDSNQLSGTVSPQLGTLINLRVLYLGGNALTGCLPLVLRGIANNDFDTLGIPFCGA